MNTMIALQAAEELRERHADLLCAGPAPGLRECAARLGVKEVELVAAQCGLEATELALPPARLLPMLASLGEVRVVTGSACCIQESRGSYQPLTVRGNVACLQEGRLDLRLFLSHWGSCYAVRDQGELSLRCHDRAGDQVHAIHLTAASDHDAYDELVRRQACRQWQMPRIEPLRLPLQSVVGDADVLRRQWLALRDAGEFRALLRRLHVPRLAALQAAGPDLAQEAGVCAITHALKVAAGARLPVQCRVSNEVAVHTQAGLISSVQRAGDWFSVQAGADVMRIDTSAIDSVWVVVQPAASGWRLDLEAYAVDGGLIVQLTGAAQGRHADAGAWRELLRGFCDEPLAA